MNPLPDSCIEMIETKNLVFIPFKNSYLCKSIWTGNFFFSLHVNLTLSGLFPMLSESTQHWKGKKREKSRLFQVHKTGCEMKSRLQSQLQRLDSGIFQLHCWLQKIWNTAHASQGEIRSGNFITDSYCCSQSYCFRGQRWLWRLKARTLEISASKPMLYTCIAKDNNT